MSHDKQLTRWANQGAPAVLLYGRWWALEPGTLYAVEFDRKEPGKSRVVRVRVASG